MDAPTTTSADNGTSDESSGGGWFTPKRPVQNRTDPGEGTSAGDADQERIVAPRRPASIRPVGSVTTRPAPPARDETRPAPPAEAPPAGGELPPEDFRAEQAHNGQGIHEAAGPRQNPGAGHNQADPRVPGRHEAPHAHQAPWPLDAVWPAESTMPLHGVGHEGPREAAKRPHEVVEPREAALPHEARSARQGAPSGEASREVPAEHHSPHPQPAGPASDASPDASLIRRTMAEIGPVADKVTSYFYALLFVRHPELRSLFPAAMDAQRDRLLKALLTAAEHMDNAEVLTEYLQHLGRGHRKYGTEPAHYPAVGEALLGALTRYATTTWDKETEAAWVRTYTTISQIMIDAAAENERQAPAWWHAEVVSHDLRTPDIAVVTVRPDQPYAFVAGQYTSLETPWWPRIWRHYSFAGAPRADGLLSFHVKAVPAGWVSNALVHHARPGDVLRLGPPAGSMTVDHSTDNGLLCLGGGTGIAPIKALVEDVAEHGERRPVEVFYGARTDYDLYDIDTMLRLQQTHPWLSVRPIVDDRAQFPDAVREFGPWYEYDAYLSGPPGMIRSGVDALRGVGIPFDRIRHDSLEELVAAGD
ncbi:NAD(P)H-flavin reductase [Streptomyces sp. SLBN-118]|uniref:globin domain-containing protein n=1 Tax=Streptomyces sp. SLBN-118 TaxID=2768454 RepID=UPI00115197AB|nr:globin domain-containing protein [Streptomyces sp. SLBN-118]TQK53109.1 NAD(P)H-flavin reductase [Streptomyces sp. SLBN-118]